jgi:hypothetical protein
MSKPGEIASKPRDSAVNRAGGDYTIDRAITVWVAANCHAMVERVQRQSVVCARLHATHDCARAVSNYSTK